MKIFLIAGALLFSSLPVVAGVGISTTSGLIFGHAASNKTGVIEYLGVPYAASTSGSNRFQLLQCLNSTDPFNASSWVNFLFTKRFQLAKSGTGTVCMLDLS
jgi:hypothetical protein